MDIERFAETSIIRMKEETVSIVENIKKVKLSGNTLYIIVKDDEIKDKISYRFLEMLRVYLAYDAEEINSLNISVLSENEIFDMGMKMIDKVNNQGMDNDSEDEKVQVKKPEEKVVSEEKREDIEEKNIQNIDAMDIWKVMLGRIQEIISPEVYQKMFKESRQTRYEAGVVYVNVKDLRTAQIMETQYAIFLQRVSAELFGIRLSFVFSVDDGLKKDSKEQNDRDIYPVNINDLNSFLEYLNSLQD